MCLDMLSLNFLPTCIQVVNAYVSGMKEDLNMSGQDYNLLQIMFTVGEKMPPSPIMGKDTVRID